MSQVFYRKWRPQLLSEVVGQEHVTRTLLNALSAGRVGHAYLFCGPRGTGKTSTGRILAKAVNCEKPKTGGKGEPCGKCAMCKAITEGRAMDVIEIDAASHTSVDDIRELNERVNYAPAQARYKVYIIDEVHMISTSASNALLKTLEEPPPKVIFVLATTEAHKVLPTIVSRCQRFDFHRLSQKDTEEKLTRICAAEGLTIAPEALRLVARSARGGLRDAENLLEQLTTYYGTSIELSQVQATLGMGDGERARELLRCLVKRDAAGGLRVIGQAQAEGLDLRQLDRALVASLRDLLLVLSGCEKEVDLTPDDLTEMKTLAQGASVPQVLRALRLFGEAEGAVGQNGTLPLELALVDATVEVAPPPAPAREAAPVRAVPPAMQAPKPAPEVAPAKPPAPPVAQAPVKSEVVPPPQPAETPAPPVKAGPPPAASTVPPKPVAKPAAPPATPPAAPKSEPPAAVGMPLTGDKLEQLKHNWRQIIEQAPMPVRRSPAVAILRSAGVVPVALEAGTVTLSFRHNFHKEKIEELENRKVVVGLISAFFGQPCQVKCIYEPNENHLVREAQKLGAQVVEVEEK